MDQTKHDKRQVDEVIRRARINGKAEKGQFSLNARVAKEKLQMFRL